MNDRDIEIASHVSHIAFNLGRAFAYAAAGLAALIIAFNWN